MSEFAPPFIAGDAAVGAAEDLSQETVESVLAEFRSWLQQVAASTPGVNHAAPPETETVDLHTLLGQFIALRHEVNLQTRAVRAQQEQSGDTLRQFGQALEALQQNRDAMRQADGLLRDEQLRPLLKTLVDVADALGLARRELQRSQERIGTALGTLPALMAGPAQTEPLPRPRLWSRWFGTDQHAVQDDAARGQQGHLEQVEKVTEQIGHLLESLITGYTMSLQRIERTLEQHGLEPMACAGAVFDPERMEAVEVVGDSGRPAGEVLEEVRRGYLWQGHVFRYAQVRVAKS
jgi:molecular chaperone GrpE